MARLITVVIPTYNAGPDFRRTLAMIRQQRVSGLVEIVVVDSGSRDETLALCREFGAVVFGIPTHEFNHGATRNLAIGRAHGDYVALTVQDAVPLDGHWLEAMVRNLDQYPGVAGVYSRQIPRPNSHPLTRQQIEDWCASSPAWRLQKVSDWEAYRRLDPRTQQELATFDNVSACLRKSAWQQVPFRAVAFGEDIDWALRALQAGWDIVYEPASAVIHSHDRSAWYELKRTYVCHKTLKALFGTQLVPRLTRILPNACGDTRRRWSYLWRQGSRKHRHFWRALALSFGNQVGQYLGGQADRLLARLGRSYARIDRLLSRGV